MRRNNKNKLLLNMILIIILTIGIGYAYLTSNLSINGTSEIASNVWDIHFDNLKVSDGSVSAINEATINSNKTDITYSIRLSRPKDYYEFTVDVVNAGTLPGKVSISTLSGINSEYQNIIDYSIKYIGGAPVNVDDILNTGRSKKIRVRVFYKDNINASDLPSSNINLNLTYTLQYIQSNEEEILPVMDTYTNRLSTTYLSDTYKDKIKTLTLKGVIEEPNNAVESWDIGVEQNGNVMAYLVPNSEDNTMYDLYIEGDGQLVANKNSSRIFGYMSNLEKINNLDILDTNNVTNMSGIFYCDFNLLSLDVSNFNTSKVTNMNYLFSGYEGNMLLEEIKGLENFDTRKVKKMSGVFENCIKLANLNLSNWYTPNVEDLSYLFLNCYSLTSLDISNFNTSSVTTMQSMFQNCEALERIIGISDFNTSKVENLRATFYGLKTEIHLDLNNWDTSNVTNMIWTFGHSEGIKELHVSNWNVEKVTNMYGAFYLTTLTNLDLSGWNTKSVETTNRMFNAAYYLETLDIRNFDFSNVTDDTYCFSGFSVPTIRIIVKDQEHKDWVLAHNHANLTEDNVVVAS